MGYCTSVQVDIVIGQALTSASPYSYGERVPLNQIGNNRDPASIPNAVVNQFISQADQRINSSLSQMYETPLPKKVTGEWTILVDEYEYDPYVATNSVNDLVAGEHIILEDASGNSEENYVKTVIDDHTIETLTNITGDYSESGCRLIRVGFPDPIPLISARLAAGLLYDKYFAAQASPNISDYGKEMRTLALNQLSDILNGKVILHGVNRIGDRFGNPWLDSSYAHRTPVDGYNTNDRTLGGTGG